jgi:hypothetical protein
MPKAIKHWTLMTLRDNLINIGAKVVNHGRYTILQMAKTAVSHKMFAAMLSRIAKLRDRMASTA